MYAKQVIDDIPTNLSLDPILFTPPPSIYEPEPSLSLSLSRSQQRSFGFSTIAQTLTPPLAHTVGFPKQAGRARICSSPALPASRLPSEKQPAPGGRRRAPA